MTTSFAGVLTSHGVGFQVDAYPLYAASSLAANALARCSFAAGKFESSHTGGWIGRGRAASQPASHSQPAVSVSVPSQLTQYTPLISRSAGKLLDEPSPKRVADTTWAGDVFVSLSMPSIRPTYLPTRDEQQQQQWFVPILVSDTVLTNTFSSAPFSFPPLRASDVREAW